MCLPLSIGKNLKFLRARRILQILPISKVRERSMEPNFREGDFVLVWKWQKNFSVGDVVVARHNNLEIIKRIKKISRGKILLAGDSKKSMKPVWVSTDGVAGKVIFRVGKQYHL